MGWEHLEPRGKHFLQTEQPTLLKCHEWPRVMLRINRISKSRAWPSWVAVDYMVQTVRTRESWRSLRDHTMSLISKYFFTHIAAKLPCSRPWHTHSLSLSRYIPFSSFLICLYLHCPRPIPHQKVLLGKGLLKSFAQSYLQITALSELRGLGLPQSLTGGLSVMFQFGTSAM